MKRKTFLKLSIGAIPGVIVGPKSVAAYRPKKGIKVGTGKDRQDKSLSLLEGDTFFTKVSSEDTNGDLYIFESTRLKKGGPSFHRHYDQDEWWYILSGEFLIKIGDETFEAKAGDSVFGPRGIPHAFTKRGEGEAKMLISFQPAGKMEAFFQAVSEGKLAKMSDEEQDNFRKAHGFERVGPPIDYMKKF
ncbi:cupin domain-containing protein [Dyadobacter frigoris]|uniref:Cupin domain-containing protein n=1 Tax=Dyadobacter frigoris TaxID=2576211 RepID=A0A4U6CT97_9BACT|nr:cupin domain-containing protein [Dyadobacter frigoris]TKT86905.1 cupin domain-containing protein [Dyadobacter frigoris]